MTENIAEKLVMDSQPDTNKLIIYNPKTGYKVVYDLTGYDFEAEKARIKKDILKWIKKNPSHELIDNQDSRSEILR